MSLYGIYQLKFQGLHKQLLFNSVIVNRVIEPHLTDSRLDDKTFLKYLYPYIITISTT